MMDALLEDKEDEMSDPPPPMTLTEDDVAPAIDVPTQDDTQAENLPPVQPAKRQKTSNTTKKLVTKVDIIFVLHL